jgi:predicted nucleic acid-binding protein
MYREYLSEVLNIKIDGLRDELDLKLILKARLTKKELKILNALINRDDIDLLFNRLNLDEKRYKELKAKMEKKLNSEKFKKEILS